MKDFNSFYFIISLLVPGFTQYFEIQIGNNMAVKVCKILTSREISVTLFEHDGRRKFAGDTRKPLKCELVVW